MTNSESPRAHNTQAGLVFPGDDWLEATPESQGVDAARLEEAMRVLAGIAEDDADGTKSAGAAQALVVRNGRLIWQGGDIDNLHIIHSCGKSFMSSVFGLLHDDGKCGPDTRAADILPAMKEHYPAATLGQFANLTSGYNVPFRASAFDIRPPLHAPGKAFHYSASSNQLAHLLTLAAGEPLRDLFRRRLAEPIGMPADSWEWADAGTVDGLVVCGGAGHVSITARQLARFGLLYLAEGRWGDRQVLSREWVRMSTRPQVAPNVPPVEPNGWYVHLPGRYGYSWWTNGVNAKGERWWPSAPPGTFAAQGNRNNYLFVVPEWNLLLVRTGHDKPINSRLYDRVFAALGKALASSSGSR